MVREPRYEYLFGGDHESAIDGDIIADGMNRKKFPEPFVRNCLGGMVNGRKSVLTSCTWIHNVAAIWAISPVVDIGLDDVAPFRQDPSI